MPAKWRTLHEHGQATQTAHGEVVENPGERHSVRSEWISTEIKSKGNGVLGPDDAFPKTRRYTSTAERRIRAGLQRMQGGKPDGIRIRIAYNKHIGLIRTSFTGSSRPRREETRSYIRKRKAWKNVRHWVESFSQNVRVREAETSSCGRTSR